MQLYCIFIRYSMVTINFIVPDISWFEQSCWTHHQSLGPCWPCSKPLSSGLICTDVSLCCTVSWYVMSWQPPLSRWRLFLGDFSFASWEVRAEEEEGSFPSRHTVKVVNAQSIWVTPPSFLSLPSPSPGAALSCGAGTFLVWRPASPLPWFAEQFDPGFKDACVEETVVETETEKRGEKSQRESRRTERFHTNTRTPNFPGEDSAPPPPELRPKGGVAPLAPVACAALRVWKRSFPSPPTVVFMFLPSPHAFSPCLMEGPVRICHQENAFWC